MIKLQDEEKTDFEQDLYESEVEEALAKWEAAKLSVVNDRNSPSTEESKGE